MKDEAQQKAEALWPCLKCDNNDSSDRSTHGVGCGYRPAMAAALREAYVRGLDDAKEIAANFWFEREDFDDAIQAEIDKVKVGKP